MKPTDFAKKKISELWTDYKLKGGTQMTLAAAGGIAQGQISDWIRGARTPGIDGLVVLGKAFKVPVTDFFPPEAVESKLFVKQRELAEILPTLKDDQVDTLLQTVEILKDPGRRPRDSKVPNKGSKA